jgi:hypothetical protein
MTKPKEDRIWKAYNDFHYFCDGARMQKMFARHWLFLQTKDLPGHIIDAGVFKGTSTLLFAHMLRIYSPLAAKKVIGFDTFEGRFEAAADFETERADAFMAYWDRDIEDVLREVIVTQDLSDFCELVKGDIGETMPRYIAENRGMRISLLHLDLDILEPTLETLRACYDNMIPGGIIVLDQYGIEGWGESEAVDTFFKERGFKPTIEAVPFSTTPTAMIRI